MPSAWMADEPRPGVIDLGEIIDLGELGSEPIREPSARRPWPNLRAVAAALVGLLIAGVITAGGPVPEPRLVAYGSVPDRHGYLAASDGHTAVVRIGGVINGYHLATGALAWSWEPPARRPIIDVRMIDDHLVVLVEPRIDRGEVATDKMAVLAAHTGEQLLATSGYFEIIDGMLLETEYEADSLLVRVRHLPSLAPAWSLDNQISIAAHRASSTVYAVSADGVLTGYDVASGAARGSVAIADWRGEAITVGVVPRAVFVNVGQPDGHDQERTVTYQHGDLTPLPAGPSVWNWYCQWQWCQYHRVYPMGEHLLLAGPADGISMRTEALVQAQTGQPLLDLRGWFTTWDFDAQAPAPVLWRRDVRDNRSYLALLDGSERVLLGSIPGITGYCFLSGRSLVCQTVDGIRAWRVTGDLVDR